MVEGWYASSKFRKGGFNVMSSVPKTILFCGSKGEICLGKLTKGEFPVEL